MAKTPEETALAAVAKAIQDEQKAQEKAYAAHEKFVALDAAAVRAHKTTNWSAAHPDLPDNFDIDAFRQELNTPFDDDLDPVQSEEGEIAAVEEGLADVENGDVAAFKDFIEDPFGELEPVPAPKRRR